MYRKMCTRDRNVQGRNSAAQIKYRGSYKLYLQNVSFDSSYIAEVMWLIQDVHWNI